MALTQSGSVPVRHAPDFRHPQIKGLAHHRQRHFDAAGAEGQHSKPARRRGVAIGPDERQARLAEALHVDGVADAVTRAAIPDAEPPAGATQEQVLVGVQVVVLNEVVVDILRGEPNLHLLDAHGLQFEHHQRAEYVLQKSLIDGKCDLIARHQRTRSKM